jgi:hypothetical protein
MKNITVTAQISKDLYDMIRKAAYLKNVSNSEIIRQCCIKQLEIELKEHKKDE